MQLIGVAGKAGCGKSTIAQWLGAERGAFAAAFAFPIKQALIGMFEPLTGLSWRHFNDRELKEAPLPHIGVSPRWLAQTLGTEFGRDCVHADVWVMMTEAHLKAMQVWDKKYQIIVLHDMRFENEAAWIRKNGGVVLHVERPGADGNVGVANHASEAGIKFESGDTRLLNYGAIEALYADLSALFPQRVAA